VNLMVSECLPLFLLNSVAFFIIWTSDIDVFSSHQQSNVQKCETVFKHLIEILFNNDVKCILGQYAVRPSVNISCDYKIVLHDSQQSYLKWEQCRSKRLSSRLFFVFELSLQQKICFPCPCNCTSIIWKCDRHFAIY